MAKNLLLEYFAMLKEEFDDEVATTKNHAVIHLADEVVKMKAPLGSYCAYAFENLNACIKRVCTIASIINCVNKYNQYIDYEL